MGARRARNSPKRLFSARAAFDEAEFDEARGRGARPRSPAPAPPHSHTYTPPGPPPPGPSYTPGVPPPAASPLGSSRGRAGHQAGQGAAEDTGGPYAAAPQVPHDAHHARGVCRSGAVLSSARTPPRRRRARGFGAGRAGGR